MNYEMDDVVTESPETEENETDKSTQDTEAGQENDNKTEDVPEDGETSEESKEKPEKKYANQFTSRSGLVKAAENLAGAMDEDVDFDKMTVEELETWYLDGRKRFSKEGFKGNREKVKQINKAASEDDKMTRLEAKLDKFLEKEPQKEQKPSAPEFTEPIEPEFDEDKYNELLLEDPASAAKMFRDFRKANIAYTKQLIEWEGAKLGMALKPTFEKLGQGYAKITQREADDEDKRSWGEAEKEVREFAKLHDLGNLDDYSEKMLQLAKDDWDYYKSIIAKDPKKGKQQAILRLFQNAVKETEIDTLKSELEAIKSGATEEQIKNAKAAARINNSHGNQTPKGQSKEMAAKQAKEESLKLVRGPSNKYEMMDYE